jgi:hypothetical protein
VRGPRPGTLYGHSAFRVGLSHSQAGASLIMLPAVGRPGIFAAARLIVRRDFVRSMSPRRSVVIEKEFV